MCEVNCLNCIVQEFKDDLCEEEFCEKFRCARGNKDFIEHVLEVVRPHGEWLYEGAMAEGHPHCAFNCSVCDGHICRIPNDLPNFCEFCGADMRKKEGEKE